MKSAIRYCSPEERSAAAHLFAGWEETMIWSCLQGVMGDMLVCGEPPVSAAVILNDFCFLAGEPEPDLLLAEPERAYIILVPDTEAWHPVIEKTLGEAAHRRCRYAIKKEPDCFDTARLTAFAGSLPAPYRLKKIDQRLYTQCRETPWCRDFIQAFPTWEVYDRLGIGYVVTENGVIVAGASSYSRYREGIEIEIDTRGDHRQKGLATVTASALILECLRLGLYPSWDAHNPVSVKLAEKLGYTFSHEYPVYEVYR
ncbi:MAG: GNAT family N-acetyltransferase [Clostridia bacterium]|nr:GNAT family N-acetyltransferase [Clostridia bacterium]